MNFLIKNLFILYFNFYEYLNLNKKNKIKLKMSCQSNWFLTLTIINIASIIVHLFTLFNRTALMSYSSLILLIIACFYWCYMYFLEKVNSGESTEGQGLITQKNTNFMADNIFRYLFVIVIGNSIYCYVFRIIYVKNRIIYFDDLLKLIFNWYSYTILPIACIIDFCGRKRNRTPNPKYDLIITLIVIALISIIDCRFTSIESLSHNDVFLLSIILNTLFMGLAYLLYDYLLFKMNGGNSYTLCPQETEA